MPKTRSLPYRNPRLPVERRIEDLLGRMTLEEKIGQLVQVDGRTPDIEGMVREKHIGSILCVLGDQVLAPQKAALGTRLGIPLLVGIDAIHGHSSEYGAAIWCDPYVWIPEAHRLLRPGGTCLFLGTSTLATVCSPVDGSLPVTDRLERDYFSLHRLDWTDAVDDPGGIEFNLPISGWFRLFADTGFDVTGFWELQAPEPGPEMRHFATADWSHRFPSEQVWRLRKR